MHVSASPRSPAQVSVPFPVMVGAGNVVRHPGWVAALEAVHAGLAAEAPVLLTGDSGLGKSLLLLALKRELEEAGQAVVLLPHGDADAPGRSPDVVLLDEADRVPTALMQGLVRRAPRCVMAGSHRVLDMLAGLAAPPVLVEMRPLFPDEVGPYLQGQVERAGLPDTLLGPGAFAALAAQSHGNPRRLQKLASSALFRAWMDNADEVSATHVAEAAAPEGQDADRLGADEPTGETLAPVSALPQVEPEAPGTPMAAPDQPAPDQPLVSSKLGGVARTAISPWWSRVLATGGAACCLALAAALVLHHGQPPAAVTSMPLPPAGAPAGSGQAPAVPPRADEPGPSPATLAPHPLVPAEQDMASAAGTGIPAPEPAAGTEPGVASLGATSKVPPPQAAPDTAPPEAAPPASTATSVAVAAAPAPDGAGAHDAARQDAVPAPPGPAVPGQQFAALPVPPVVPALPRPPTTPLHVVVAFMRSDAAAESRGVSLAGTLQKVGMDAVLGAGVPAGKDVVVAYYYPGDKAAAAQVAMRAGVAGREHLAAIRGTLPRPGTIQVVLPVGAAPGHETP